MTLIVVFTALRRFFINVYLRSFVVKIFISFSRKKDIGVYLIHIKLINVFYNHLDLNSGHEIIKKDKIR